MFVDVYPLRRNGDKLPKHRLVGIRGRLRITSCWIVGKADRPKHRSMTATVHTRWPQPFPGHAEASLHDVRITRLDERGFVLVGLEVVLNGLGASTYPQAWACVPVATDTSHAAAASPSTTTDPEGFDTSGSA